MLSMTLQVSMRVSVLVGGFHAAATQAGLPKQSATIDCVPNTGGNCITEDCHEWRGNTRCNNDLVNRRCFCVAGECSGADGICRDKNNTKVADLQRYRISNARWPDYYIDIDGASLIGNNVGVEKAGYDEDRLDDKFTLRLLSWEGGSGATKLTSPAFLIASVRWPDSVLYTYGLVKLISTCHNVYGLLGGLANEPEIRTMAMQFTIAPDQDGVDNPPVMMSSVQFPTQYLYVSSMSWEVLVQNGDPGAGGSWYFDPPLPKDITSMFKTYSGSRCSVNCGSVAAANGVALSGRSGLVAAAVTLSAVLAAWV